MGPRTTHSAVRLPADLRVAMAMNGRNNGSAKRQPATLPATD
jgi:hypothetical protein